MKDSEIRQLIERKNAERDPLNFISSKWAVLVGVFGVIAFAFNLQSEVEANSKDIQTLKIEIQSTLTDIEELISAQSERFELYAEALRNHRIDRENDLDSIDQRFDSIERDLLLINEFDIIE